MKPAGLQMADTIMAVINQATGGEGGGDGANASVIFIHSFVGSFVLWTTCPLVLLFVHSTIPYYFLLFILSSIRPTLHLLELARPLTMYLLKLSNDNTSQLIAKCSHLIFRKTKDIMNSNLVN